MGNTDPYAPFWELNKARFPKMTVDERVVQLAAYSADVIHVQENPAHDNTGDVVDRYAAVAGLHGVAWCLLFQMWLLLKSFVSESKLPPKRERGSCAAVAAWARRTRCAMPVAEARRGDILIRLNRDGTGHAGVKLGGPYTKIRTIEGNTNDDGSREGYEVCRKTRPGSYWTIAVRIR